MINKKDKRWYWIALGLLVIVLRYIAGSFPEVVESVYSRGLFQVVRYVFGFVFGLFPFPTLYLWGILLLIGLVVFFYRLFKNYSGWKARMIHLVISCLALIGGGIFLFLFLWGFNYARVPLEDQMGIDPQPISKSTLFAELEIHTTHIKSYREQVPGNGNSAMTDSTLPADLESIIRTDVKRTMKELGYPTGGPIQGRRLFKGSLLRIGTAGFYLPFTGECNIDAGLHPLQKPYVMAHEYAHGLGIGDEGSCNFIAYLTCTSSSNAFVKYSGALSFWRSLASSYLAYDNAHYRAYRAELPAGIIADLDAINENSRSYPDLFPDFRDKTYDAFLRTQGIDEGMKNYSRVILLEYAWRERERLIIND